MAEESKKKDNQLEKVKSLGLREKVINMRNAVSLGKDGQNKHHKYNYFKPDSINNEVNKLCMKYRVYDEFQMRWVQEIEQYHIKYTLENLDKPEELLSFEFEIPLAEIAIANPAQKFGGTLTYGKRYAQMNAFNIGDNKDDLDSDEMYEKSQKEKAKRNSSPSKGNTTSRSATTNTTSRRTKTSSEPKEGTTTSEPEAEEKTERATAKGSNNDRPQSNAKDKPATEAQIKFITNLQGRGKIPKDLVFEEDGEILITGTQASDIIDKGKNGKEQDYNYKGVGQSTEKETTNEDQENSTKDEGSTNDGLGELNEDELPF